MKTGFGIAILCALGALSAACESGPPPTSTPTPTPAPPDISGVRVVHDEPASFCADGRIIVWDRVSLTPEERAARGPEGGYVPGISLTLEHWSALAYGMSIESFGGWIIVDEPGYSLPPAAGNEVKVVGFSGRGNRKGWTGDRVRIYAYPVEEDMRGMDFWPRSGEDIAVGKCLRQTAFLLGEGPVNGNGQPSLDFALHLPEMVQRAGEEYALEGLASLGDLALFAVTDTGYFVVGPSMQLVAPYTLTVTPERAALGETVVIEGSGFAPTDGSVVVSVPVAWASGDIGGPTEAEIGQAPIRDGSFRIEWTAPESLPYASIGFLNAKPCAFSVNPRLAEQQIDILVTVLDAGGNLVRDDYRVSFCVAL